MTASGFFLGKIYYLEGKVESGEWWDGWRRVWLRLCHVVGLYGKAKDALNPKAYGNLLERRSGTRVPWGDCLFAAATKMPS
jgi:hypothetical protein